MTQMERGTEQALQETNDRLRGRETAIRASLPLSPPFCISRSLLVLSLPLSVPPAARLSSSGSAVYASDLSDKGFAVARCTDANANSRLPVFAPCQIVIHSIYKSSAADYAAGNVYPAARLRSGETLNHGPAVLYRASRDSVLLPTAGYP